MRVLRHVTLLLLVTVCTAACATAPEASSPLNPPATPPPSSGAEEGSTGSGEVLCPPPEPGVTPEPGCEPPTEPEGELVTPRPGMADTHPVNWTRAEPVGDGSVLRISYTAGVEPCSVLDRVEVAETADTVIVTVVEGSDPAFPDTACIALGVLKAVEVPLAAPLGDRTVVDGAGP